MRIPLQQWRSMRSESPRALFVVNGFGLGNSTRSLALAKELNENGFVIDVATFENGLECFGRRTWVRSVHELWPLSYRYNGKHELSVFKTILASPKLILRLLLNDWRILRLILRLKPDKVILDSQYPMISTLLFRGRTVAINNSKEVLQWFFKFRPFAWNLLPHLVFVELLDFIYHWVIVRKVLVPSLPNFQERCSLLVRNGLCPGERAALTHITIMVSGSNQSGLGFDPDTWQLDLDILVMGAPGSDSRNVKYHGKDTDNINALNRADLLILNGGLSSLSEGLALRKPMVILPLKNHAEQFVNAKRLERLGVAMVTSPERIGFDIHVALARYSQMRKAYDDLDIDENAAPIMARRLINMTEREPLKFSAKEWPLA